MRKKLVAANWKMNLQKNELENYLELFLNSEITKNAKVDIHIYSPSIYIDKLVQNTNVVIGSQNVFWQDMGAFTGEISCLQLKSIGCNHTLIGHSERRNLFNENNEIIQQKIINAIHNDFNIILCVGEPIFSRQSGSHLEFVADQLSSGLKINKINPIENITIAYEPIWAIGTGLTADIKQINEMHNFIRDWLIHEFKQDGEKIRIIYGGSCHDQNVNDIFSCTNVDGGLIGGASLDVMKFLKILEIANGLH